jgi:phosphopantetheinyl transferase
MQIIYDNINNYNDNEYRTMFNYLNTNDKKTISKLIRINDKKRSILSKYLLKSIISQKYHLDYNNIHFNENNKPFIDGIYFNISFDKVTLIIKKHPPDTYIISNIN